MPPTAPWERIVSREIRLLFTHCICYWEVYRHFSGEHFPLGGFSTGIIFCRGDFRNDLKNSQILKPFSNGSVLRQIFQPESIARNFPGETFRDNGIVWRSFPRGAIYERNTFHARIFCGVGNFNRVEDGFPGIIKKKQSETKFKKKSFFQQKVRNNIKT